MNIYAKAGAQVRYLDKNGGDLDVINARKAGLVCGKVYVVDSTDVHGFVSYVLLKGFEGLSFNTVMFEDYGEMQVKPPEPKLYYIRSYNHDQHDPKGMELALWWCPDSRGYTYDLSRAGRYTEEQALAICGPLWVPITPTNRRKRTDSSPSSIAYPINMVDHLTMLTVNKFDVENARIEKINHPDKEVS